jgi:predicted nucleic acid-binding protein
MRLLIDANILLDVLQMRPPHWQASAAVWKLCETERAEGYISALTFANLVYVLRKELRPPETEDLLKKLRLIFRMADLNASDLTKAAELCWEDFEDAVQAATAERIMADHIITRNVRDFQGSKVPALTPAELIARL